MFDDLIVDIAEWVENARNDPQRYLERQATEIVLNAIGAAPEIGNNVILKGGVLMGVVYGSPRQTADIDYTTTLKPIPEIDTIIRETLNEELRRVAPRLGYPDIACQVQSIKKRPRPGNFVEANFPALLVRVGYARRGSSQEGLYNRGRSPLVIEADISFNEPVGDIQNVKLGENGALISVYSLSDLIAEKLRALLQQERRNRYRRQDVYDIALLLNTIELDEAERARLFQNFIQKCEPHNILPNMNSLSSPEIIRRAKAEWDSLDLELGEIPSFNECFIIVENFYRNLPWDTD